MNVNARIPINFNARWIRVRRADAGIHIDASGNGVDWMKIYSEGPDPLMPVHEDAPAA